MVHNTDAYDIDSIYIFCYSSVVEQSTAGRQVAGSNTAGYYFRPASDFYLYALQLTVASSKKANLNKHPPPHLGYQSIAVPKNP